MYDGDNGTGLIEQDFDLVKNNELNLNINKSNVIDTITISCNIYKLNYCLGYIFMES